MLGTEGQCSITRLQCGISLCKVEDGESDRDRKSDISDHKRIAGDHKIVLRAPKHVSEFTRLVLASTKHTTSFSKLNFHAHKQMFSISTNIPLVNSKTPCISETCL